MMCSRGEPIGRPSELRMRRTYMPGGMWLLRQRFFPINKLPEAVARPMPSESDHEPACVLVHDEHAARAVVGRRIAEHELGDAVAVVVGVGAAVGVLEVVEVLGLERAVVVDVEDAVAVVVRVGAALLVLRRGELAQDAAPVEGHHRPRGAEAAPGRLHQGGERGAGLRRGGAADAGGRRARRRGGCDDPVSLTRFFYGTPIFNETQHQNHTAGLKKPKQH